METYIGDTFGGLQGAAQRGAGMESDNYFRLAALNQQAIENQFRDQQAQQARAEAENARQLAAQHYDFGRQDMATELGLKNREQKLRESEFDWRKTQDPASSENQDFRTAMDLARTGNLPDAVIAKLPLHHQAVLKAFRDQAQTELGGEQSRAQEIADAKNRDILLDHYLAQNVEDTPGYLSSRMPWGMRKADNGQSSVYDQRDQMKKDTEDWTKEKADLQKQIAALKPEDNALVHLNLDTGFYEPVMKLPWAARTAAAAPQPTAPAVTPGFNFGIPPGVPATPSGPVTPPPAPQIAPMPRNKMQLVSGMIYQTPRGTARWDGQQFIPQ